MHLDTTIQSTAAVAINQKLTMFAKRIQATPQIQIHGREQTISWLR